MNTDKEWLELNSVLKFKLAHEKQEKWSAGLQPAFHAHRAKAGYKPALRPGMFLFIPHLRLSVSICGFPTS